MMNQTSARISAGLMTAAVLCILSGCGDKAAKEGQPLSTLTPQYAAEVNTAENLLKRYRTVTYAQLDHVGGNTIHLTFYTNDAGERCIVEDDNAYEAYRTDALALERENGETTYHIYGEQSHLISEYLLTARGTAFTSQTEDGNGGIRCEMKSEIDEDYAEALENWSVTTEDQMLTTEVFAADDTRPLALDFTILHPNGTTLEIASAVLLYDEAVPYSELVNAYDHAEKASVTVTLADGSTRTASIPKEAHFTWSCDEGYALYADPEGQIKLAETSEPLSEDTTLYVFKDQES